VDAGKLLIFKGLHGFNIRLPETIRGRGVVWTGGFLHGRLVIWKHKERYYSNKPDPSPGQTHYIFEVKFTKGRSFLSDE
jgi:hypothetical protein